MSDEQAFQNLIQRVRSGDEGAAEEIVREYESVIRRVVRLRLRRDSPVRRVLDSMDLCQAVLASFFVRAALGQYDLEKPDDLVKLLAVMTRNKLIDQVRRPQTRQLGESNGDSTNGTTNRWISTAASPSHVAVGKELLAMVRDRLSTDECLLVEQRVAGRTWGELATQFGESAEAIRKRHARALDRVAREIDLDEGYDE